MEFRKFRNCTLIFVLLLAIITCLKWSTNCNKKNVKQVVILSSTFNQRYLFLLPFTALFWKRLGVHPIIILIGNETIFESNLQSRETLKFLKEIYASIYYFQPKKLSSTSLSQIIRLFGAVLPLSKDLICEDTVIITSDADLVVFNISNHIPDIAKNKTIHIYNSDCCGPVKVPPLKGNYAVKMYPMGTIAATQATWKNIMGFNKEIFNIDEIEDYVENEFGKNFFNTSDDTNPKLVGSSIWYADQSLFSYKFDEWIKNPSNIMLISKHSNAPRRIDRIKWPSAKTFADLNVKNYDDAHLPVAAYSEKEWKKFFSFLKFAFKNHKNLQNKFVTYRASFCQSFTC